MPWEKTPPETLAAFEAARPKDPNVERKPMFGFASYFLNGNMFAGTFKDQVMVRLADADRTKLKGAKPFEPMPGRPMKQYVAVPRSAVTKPGELAKWMALAHAHAKTLPPKGATAGTVRKKTSAKGSRKSATRKKRA